MGLSRTDLINRALVFLGERRIFSSSQETPTAQTLDSIYDHTRKKLLEEHEWSFAKTFSRQPAQGSSTDSGWDYSYKAPTDLISIISVNDTEKGWSYNPNFEIANDLIFTNEESCVIWYIKDPGDGGNYTPSFEDAFAKTLAADSAQSRTNSQGQAEQLMNLANRAVAKAKAKDSLRSKEPKPSLADFPYINSRRAYWNTGSVPPPWFSA